MSFGRSTCSIDDQNCDVTCERDRPRATLNTHQSDPMSAIYTVQVSNSPPRFLLMYAQTAALCLSSVQKQKLMRQLLRLTVPMCLFYDCLYLLQARAANATLSNACDSQLVAQAVSTAAGQAAAQAVSAAYGTAVNCSASN